MKKITFKKTVFFALSCMIILTQSALAGNQYWGSPGTTAAWNTSNWSAVGATTPFGSGWTAGSVAYFNTANSTILGPSAGITIGGIVATENLTLSSPTSSIISNVGNGVITIDVSSGKTVDFSTQTVTAQATAGYIKNGAGVFAMQGNTYGGGFTLNAGTLITRGNNAMGGNVTTNVLTINGGTIASDATPRDFSNKYSIITIGGDFTIGATTGLALTNANITFNTATPLGSATRAITIGGTGIYTWGGVISGNAGVGLTVNSTAAGYLKLSGANTYTGTTTINTGTIRLGNSSALGTVDGGTIINSTSNTSGGILDLYGTNYSSAEPLTVNGNGTGGGAIVNTIATEATFAGPITLGSATVIAGGGAKINLTNTIGGTGSLTIGGGIGGVASGVMSMTGSLVTAGNWTISGANTYSGSTSVTTSGKTLTLGASEVIPNGSAVILNNATLQTGATTGFSETAGTLQLATNSATIALGTGVHTLTFADSHLVAWTAAKTLTITGWTGDATTGATAGKIFVGTTSAGLTATQLAQITFNGYAAGAQILSTGEIVPASIAAPTLTAAVGATVDGAFDVTFTDNATWRGTITSITVGGTTLDPSAYNTTVVGKITFTPSASALLQSAGAKSIVFVATNYFNATLSQTIGAGVPTSNSTAVIDAALAKNASSTITCTAKDQYNNLVSGYTFKYDLTVTNSDATTAESYTIDGTSRTTTASDVTLTATTNSSGVATFTAALPATVDGGDGVSIQVQLTNGTTNIGAAFSFSSITYNLSGAKYSNDLTLNGTSDVIVSSGEFIINSSPEVHSITVAPGAKITHSSGTLIATNGITLESDATGTATLMDSYSSPTINATVKQYVTSGRNWYLSSPVSAADYTWLSRGTSVQGWDEATKAWVPVTNGTLVKGKGYVQVATTIVSPPSTTGTTGTVNVTGTTNSGDIAITVSRTESGSNRGFNLVGNPYPSYLKWTGANGFLAEATNDSISTSFWYRTKNSSEAYVFTTYNGSSHLVVGGSTVNSILNEYIPPMQAFWIRVDANASVTTHNVNLTFKNNMRFHGVGDNNKFKAPKANERQLVRLQLANGSQSDEALIYFDANAANTFDNYDSPKMMNNSNALPDLYTTVANERLAINGLNELADNMELPLGFTLKTSATGLKLKVSELSNLASGTKVYLLDKEQGSQTELLPSTEYTFNTTTSTTNNESRFSLLFRAPNASTGIENTEKGNTQVLVYAANQISIVAKPNSNYAIYNSVGQLIENGILTNKLHTINCKLNTGVYVVKVNNQSTRVIIK